MTFLTILGIFLLSAPIVFVAGIVGSMLGRPAFARGKTSETTQGCSEQFGIYAVGVIAGFILNKHFWWLLLVWPVIGLVLGFALEKLNWSKMNPGQIDRWLEAAEKKEEERKAKVAALTPKPRPVVEPSAAPAAAAPAKASRQPAVLYAFFTRAQNRTVMMVDTTSDEKWKLRIGQHAGLPEAEVILVRDGEWEAPAIADVNEVNERFFPGVRAYLQEHTGRAPDDAELAGMNIGRLSNPMTGLVVFLVKR